MIVVIDYESGNLRSISKALEEVGAKAKVSENPIAIAKAKGIVLPGVGAFPYGMKVLRKKGLLSPILHSVRGGTPFLGICLGLQLLFTESEEYGLHKGLDIIKGRVRKLPGRVKIPHLGWNEVKFHPAPSDRKDFHAARRCGVKIFDGVSDNSFFYFVHSYYVEPDDKENIAGRTLYGVNFTSCIIKDNIWGVQFHPEKSSSTGLKILENFCRHAS